jgi:hypothetical protein
MEYTDITSARYIQSVYDGSNSGIRVTIDDQTFDVPLDPNNRHYAEIMRQVEAGTLTIQEAE